MIDKGLKRIQKALMLVERINKGHQLFDSKKILENQIQKQILRAQKVKWYKERQLKEHKIELFKSTIEVNMPDLTDTCNELIPQVDKRIDIPDYLICRISDDLMDEPVMLSSGFTYEKSMIQQHFNTNGNFDPMTREEVNTKFLTINKHIKNATEDFLR